MKSIKYNIVETTDPKQNVLQSIQKVQNKLARLLNHSKLIDRINSRTLFDNLNSMLSVNQINAQIKIAEAWKSTKMSKYPIKFQKNNQEMDPRVTRSVSLGNVIESLFELRISFVGLKEVLSGTKSAPNS